MLAVAAACSPAKKKAPPAPQAPTLTRTDFVSGLSSPWDMGFLGDGTMYFTERPGNIKVRRPNGTFETLATQDLPPTGPDVRAEDVAGMLGLAIDPHFTSNRRIYTCFSSTDNDVRVARWTLNAAGTTIVERTDIVTGIPLTIQQFATHAGCRVRFQPGTSNLLITTGDAQTASAATDPNNLGGKVLRVDTEGNAVPGNGSSGNDLIYTRGHRNPQGLAFRGGASYGVEHGPGLDDEVNRLVAGGNYGWDGDHPSTAGYDQNVPMTDTVQYPSAIEAVWSSGAPTIAPSGGTFLSGAQWKGWNGALALAALHRNEGGFIRILFLAGDQLAGQVNAVIGNAPSPLPRLRSVVQGPDGNLYIATDVPSGGGAIWRVVPT